MTQLRDTQSAATAQPQSVALIARAEVARLFRQGGMATGLIVSAVVGVVFGALSILLLSSIAGDSGSDAVSVTGSLEVAGTVTALGISLVICTFVGRDISSGLLETMAVLVPSRRRRVLARWLGVSAAVAMTAVSTIIVTAALIMAIDGVSGRTLAVAGASLLVVPLSTVVFASLAFFIATLTRRPMLSVLVLVGLYIVLPLAAALVQGALPAELAPAINALVEASPTLLFIKAVGVSTVGSAGPWPLASGLFGLLAWAAASAVVATSAIRRREG